MLCHGYVSQHLKATRLRKGFVILTWVRTTCGSKLTGSSFVRQSCCLWDLEIKLRKINDCSWISTDCTTPSPILSLLFWTTSYFLEPNSVSMMVLIMSSVLWPFKWQLLHSTRMWYGLLAVQDGLNWDICGWNPCAWSFDWRLLWSMATCCCLILYKVILTWKSVYSTLVSYHSKEGYACPLYEFQPFSCYNSGKSYHNF